MGILVSGDTHCAYDLAKLHELNLKEKLGFRYNKVRDLVACGDCGAIWNSTSKLIEEERSLLAFHDSMPWETLVVLGNNEGKETFNLRGYPIFRAMMTSGLVLDAKLTPKELNCQVKEDLVANGSFWKARSKEGDS